MERITGHYDKIILTLIMCLAILFMAAFSPFAESTKAVPIVADAIIAILIVGLAAVGITFTVTAGYDELKNEVADLFAEFAEDNNTTTDALLNGCQSGTNKLGQLLLNNRFVQLIQTFGAWLKAKFSLTNNTTTQVVTAGTFLDGIALYQVPLTISTIDSRVIAFITISGNGDVYATFATNGNIKIMSTSSGITCNVKYMYSDGRIISQYNFPLSNKLGAWYYYDNGFYGVPDSYIKYPEADINAAMSDTVIDENNIGIDIVTGEILLPFDDSNYTDGDGAIIDLNANWGSTYQDVIDDVIPDAFSDSEVGTASIEYVSEDEAAEEVESTSEITNLPAGTIPFTPLQLPSLQLSSIWHYVAQWIQDTAIAAGSLMAIVTQSPSPMVNLFYATVCLAIIFGVIKGVAK